jgi:alanine racemase
LFKKKPNTQSVVNFIVEQIEKEIIEKGLRPGDKLPDMVRSGIAIYGLAPSSAAESLALKPVLSLKTRIIHLKPVPSGFSISYDSTYRTVRPTVIRGVFHQKG